MGKGMSDVSFPVSLAGSVCVFLVSGLERLTYKPHPIEMYFSRLPIISDSGDHISAYAQAAELRLPICWAGDKLENGCHATDFGIWQLLHRETLFLPDMQRPFSYTHRNFQMKKA